MFGHNFAVIGMVHVLPLPGSAGWRGSMQPILESAVADARAYKEGGIDAVMLENMHDAPYLRGYVEPETTAALAVVASAVKKECLLPVGIQILAGANLEALGVALAAELDFMRVEGFVFAHIGDEGWHESCAAQLIRRRAALRAEHIKIWVDIKKKHSAHAITADVSLAETAEAADFFCADGVIVTGTATGVPPSVGDVKETREAFPKDVLVGSGVTVENIYDYMPYCNAVIVGSSLKHEGCWRNAVDIARVQALMKAVPDR